MHWSLILIAIAVAWVGHACVWTALLNNVYGRPWPKLVLKLWRHGTGLLILAFPLLLLTAFDLSTLRDLRKPTQDLWPLIVLAYSVLCLIFGGLIFPVITVQRLRRKPSACVVSETTRTLDLWRDYGDKLVGDGHFAFAGRLPGNGAFRIDFTDLTLALPDLPAAWEGLSILVISDVHFHGSPSRLYFDRIIDELTTAPPPDLVCVLGDIVDTDTHREWIEPVLGRLSAIEGKFAILGNHDRHYDPDRLRADLAAAGYVVLGNGWRDVTIRGERCVMVGHEGPWLGPRPDLNDAPSTVFRLGLSHTPDNVYWASANGVDLLLCGHVHGGEIRIPVVGSIFVPSLYGRRFDMGVFEEGRTIMVVGRGISCREPIRYGCNPQVIRLRLVAGPNRDGTQRG